MPALRKIDFPAISIETAQYFITNYRQGQSESEEAAIYPLNMAGAVVQREATAPIGAGKVMGF
jgi:hypothetical protein